MNNIVMIDKEIISRCRNYKIDGEHIGTALFLLESIYYKYKNEDVLTVLNDQGNDFSMFSLHKNLELNGILKLDKIGWLLTDRGFDFVIWYINYREKILGNLVIEPEPGVTEDSIELWIEDWRNLWRNNKGVFIKEPSGRSLGISKKDAILKLTAFIENYHDLFTDHKPKDLILTATKNYLSEYKKVGYAFCKRADYFISKREGKTSDSNFSSLATECDNVIHTKEKTTKYNVFKKST